MTGPRVTVTPVTFSLVAYDAARIAELVSEVGAWFGLGPDDEVRIDVTEQSPLAEVVLTSTDPPVLHVDGGAFEDAKNPRNLSERAVRTVAARCLARVADRRRPGFADAPPEGELTIAQLDAWDCWALGRAARHGLDVHQPRWRYRFRTRHGFTDAADRAFDRLWAAEDLAWSDLAAACEQAAATPGRGR
jgi:hypothetical protein